MTEVSGQIIKADKRGRIRVTRERRQSLIQEFEQSGLSAAQFAQVCGVKYQTLATWIRKAHRAKPTGRKPGNSPTPLQWFETVVAPASTGSVTAHGLMVLFPDGVRLEVRDLSHVPLAAALIRTLGQAC